MHFFPSVDTKAVENVIRYDHDQVSFMHFFPSVDTKVVENVTRYDHD
jgi:peroxiredoxin